MLNTAPLPVHPPAAAPVWLVLLSGARIEPDLAARAGIDHVVAAPPQVHDVALARPILLLGGPAEAETLARGLALPHRGFVEVDEDGLLGLGARCPAAARADGIVLSLRTASAYRLDCVGPLARALARRFGPVDSEARELVEICLAEAIGNAVIHGNLEIPDHLRTTAEGFERFRGVLRDRIGDPTLAARRVEIRALPADGGFTLAVSDQGRGFDLAEQLRRVVRADARCGRGLGLIRRAASGLAAEDDGRTLVMRFQPRGAA